MFIQFHKARIPVVAPGRKQYALARAQVGRPCHEKRVASGTIESSLQINNLLAANRSEIAIRVMHSASNAFREHSGHTILERYGMSEAGIITFPPIPMIRNGGAVPPAYRSLAF